MPGGTAPGGTPSSARSGHCLSAYIEQIAHKQPPQAQVRGAIRSVRRVVFGLQLRRAGAVGAGAATRAGTPTAADRHLGPINLPARAAARQGHRSAADVCRMFVDVPRSRRGVCGRGTEGQGTRRAIAELDRRPSGRHLAVAAHVAGSLWSPLPLDGRLTTRACRCPGGIPARHSSKDGNTFVAGHSVRQTSKAGVPDR